MTCLLIDIGNSRIKWGTDSVKGFEFGGSCDSHVAQVEQLFAQFWNQLRPEHIFISCVGDMAVQQRIFEMAQARWDVQTESLVSPKQENGITNIYDSPEKLGSDRWAAMVGAFKQFEGAVCVVDCGTAVTLDVINYAGHHLGGLIIPGNGLMQDCLSGGTLLDFHESKHRLGPNHLGKSTEQCIQLGTISAIGNMIDGTFNDLSEGLDTLTMVLTGGDVDLIEPVLKNEHVISPHLVLQGLAEIHRARYAVASS